MDEGSFAWLDDRAAPLRQAVLDLVEAACAWRPPT
jgi:hypothetical protein